jgi:four helix bundle protein
MKLLSPMKATIIKRFEDIEAWQHARILTQEIYRLTKSGEFSRDYGLRDQVQRSSVSVMSNIAEGYESRTDALFLDYLGRAKASCGEVRSELYVASDADYIDAAQFAALRELAERCSGKICNFMAYLHRSSRA